MPLNTVDFSGYLTASGDAYSSAESTKPRARGHGRSTRALLSLSPYRSTRSLLCSTDLVPAATQTRTGTSKPGLRPEATTSCGTRSQTAHQQHYFDTSGTATTSSTHVAWPTEWDIGLRGASLAAWCSSTAVNRPRHLLLM